ncbi:hypothetical protein EW146_g5951 [Bondarzewia mesenterica]|uniref:DNA-directed RNA polymerase n=1 Tax=Bondarzewia mesenterica TaxID=1095465 RepID=A0A4S4LQ09_9AGAM|nr:hypothetical protein EW146_g5951 [Bondarzewia mesenterica]
MPSDALYIRRQLQHRIVMAPMTRLRANNRHEHTDLGLEYYSQRASVPGTLIIAEATLIAAKAGGYPSGPSVPGIWTDEHIARWKKITEEVHGKGSFIYLQLFALGRMADPAVLALDDPSFEHTSPGDIPLSNSATPRPLTIPEIKEYVELHATAASNAVHKAGFDGVEIHAANGVLVDQFLQTNSNNRTDEYGGSIENRIRFPLEVVEASMVYFCSSILFAWAKLDMRMPDPIPTFTKLVTRVRDIHPDFGYLHVVEPPIDRSVERSEKIDSKDSNDFLREIWGKRMYLAAGGFDRASAIETADTKGGLIVFAKKFLANALTALRARCTHGASHHLFRNAVFTLIIPHEINMASRAFCIPGIAIFFCAFVLGLLVSISLPSFPALDIVRAHFDGTPAQNGGSEMDQLRARILLFFGIWAYCTYDASSGHRTCINQGHGYSVTVQSHDGSNSIAIGSSWARGLAVHPVATIVTFLTLLLSFSSHITLILMSSIAAGIAALLTLIAFAIDLALFVFTKHKFGDLVGISEHTIAGPGRSAHRKLETTLLSYSRQRLPRPARLYSTPTKRASFPSVTTPPPAPEEFPAFLGTPQSAAPAGAELEKSDMVSFLRKATPYTIIPTPLPMDQQSAANDMYFTDSPTQDLLAIMDACLHNLYDVRRARQIFDNLRVKRTGDPVLSARLYNSFIEAYLIMASDKEPTKRALWVEDVWVLIDVMLKGSEKVNPTAGTFALALSTWLRFSSENSPNVIDVSTVVADRSISSSEEAEQIILTLSQAAVELNLSKIVLELGQAEALGSTKVDPLADVPEVKPVMVPVKNKGEESEGTQPTETMPFNLEVLRRHLAQVALARRVLPEDVAARQKLLEDSVYDVAVERLRRQAELLEGLGLDDNGLKQADLQKWMWEWHQKLQERLRADVMQLVREEDMWGASIREQRERLGPFLSLVKPEKLSLITILEIMRLQGTGGVSDGMKTARALLAVGKAIELEYKAEMCKKNNIQIPANVSRSGEQGYFSRFTYTDLHARRVTARKYMEDGEEWTSDWTQMVKVKVGSFLVDRLMEAATVSRSAFNKMTGKMVTEEHPAFFHSYEYLRGHKLGVIKLNQVVAERLAKDGLRETLHPRHLPMLVKPKPWLSHNEGGYLYNKAQAMRFKDSQEQQTYLKHASAAGNVELVYAGLDVLGSTPWKINRRVFEVVLEVWNSGDRLAKIPPTVFDTPEPEKPEDVDTDPKVRSVYLQRQRAWLQAKANNHSERCNVNYKIEIARAFLADVFYLPHNLDFRGRAYPIPPHLNHIGDDLSRGLLLFGESRPLGERGLRWLKIHLANLYGFDKATFDERVEFVHKHLDDIYDSVDHPLDGRRWWLQADDPWQCLSTSMELKAAIESPNPLEYECSLPVHQDGTCNGLQHYAALGGDARGAKQVNLDVADRPSDVYTYVANMVEKLILEDIQKGNKTAALLSGKVSRKVVKQTVMTTVYGVTFIGAREQIEKQLKDRSDIPEEEIFYAAAYLAKKVLQCIGDLFQGAQDIMNWLTMSARLIAKSVPADRLSEAMSMHKTRRSKKAATTRLKKEQMTAVVWTTPLGLPIVQPYRKSKRRQIMTSLQSVYISDPNSPAEVDAQKQASAFPPNFIHSLDATHMLLTALECRTQGLAFASVHDSYWTHPSTIDQMSSVIRDTFIALHSSDVLSRLDTEFRIRYKDFKVPIIALKQMQAWRKLEFDPTDIATADEDAFGEDDGMSAAPEDAEDLDAIENPDRPTATTVSREELIALLRPGKGRGKRPPLAEDGTESTEGKFVNLIDLLPSLPKKGEFDVSKIKSSLYFFS